MLTLLLLLEADEEEVRCCPPWPSLDLDVDLDLDSDAGLGRGVDWSGHLVLAPWCWPRLRRRGIASLAPDESESLILRASG